MLLAIASGDTLLDVTPKSASTALTLRNGLSGLGISKGPSIQGDSSNAAKQIFYDFGERPMWTERSYVTAPKFWMAILSGRREDLAIYFWQARAAFLEVQAGQACVSEYHWLASIHMFGANAFCFVKGVRPERS